MKICVYTLGCKVNQYESDSIISALHDRGYQVIDTLDYADVFILNTCAVTQEAERKSRQLVSRVRKLNPESAIYVIGCASENNAEQFIIKDGVKFISGVAGKNRLNLFEDLKGVDINALPLEYEENYKPLSLRARYYLKVQDGCNNFCSYCILPYLRGRSRSRKIDSIVSELKEIAKSTNEVVLTGINLSHYGKDLGLSLNDLLMSIKGIVKRLRLGSLEIRIINHEMLNILKGLDEFCPHFHLSLQNGDNKVLKDMNRHYTREEFIEKVDLIREYFPEAAITTDIIVGFPTECDEAFENTINLVNRVKFADIHIFPYSRRPKTKAYILKVLDKRVIVKRIKDLEQLKTKYRKEYIYKYAHKPMEVLVEECVQGVCSGHTRNYIKIYTNKNVDIKDIVIVEPNEIIKAE